jgi:hypothetical protein
MRHADPAEPGAGDPVAGEAVLADSETPRQWALLSSREDCPIVC